MPRHSRFLFARGAKGRTPTFVAAVIASIVCSIFPGCLRRPVSEQQPTTKSSFEIVVPQPAIEKIDLLVMVDNSSSMLDKQRILADAAADLVKALVLPKCVDKKTGASIGVVSDPTKPDQDMCPTGSEPTFPPITDMHIGVISSSLGGMGASTCAPSASAHNDDHGHLLARGPRDDVAAAGDLHFLAWYPDVEKNQDKVRHPDPPVPKTKNVDDLGAAFRDLIAGVGQDGCGLEAQLESVYRFLVQPDPWTAIEKTGSGAATYGPTNLVDGELLRQRAAFLRPDSLVAVIVLTDEDDSSADPLSLAGSGWRFMDRAVRDRATAPCADDPTSDKCTSCALASGAPGCVPEKYSEAEDVLNVRFHHMKQRFGVDPQFPISRYVDGLTKPRVPRRDKEHDASGNYAPEAGCTNPLFAARLPTSTGDDLCGLPRGPRSPSLIYFALIGGVPSSLVPPDLLPDGRQKIDWTKVLGRDPSRWDERDIDPHMIQSSRARAGLPPPSSNDDADPVHGREWTTGDADLQFACTFDLYERLDDASGTATPVRRTCSASDRANRLCDCDGTKDTPLCAADDRNVQIRGKAYPTRRELMLARELAAQGIVASLCPKQLTSPEADDYGYRPAVRAVTSRLERQLVGSCLPRALERQDQDGNVACLVLAMLPDPGPDSDCGKFGLAPPSPSILEPMRDKLRATEGEEATHHPICAIPQVAVPAGEVCKDASDGIAFCYEESPRVTSCPHAIAFTKASQKLTSARFTMQCIQQAQD